MALRREDARNVRYDRPVSVVLLDLTGGKPVAHLDVIAGDVADVIRTQARSTDRAVRFLAGSFRILMPETTEQAAKVAAARLQRSFASTPSGGRGEPLHIAVVTSSRGRSLFDVLAAAEERLRTAESRRASPRAER